MAKKKFSELQLCDAFLFAATLTDPELCRMLLERVLDFPISKVMVRVEESLFFNPECRGVRLDVYAEDENHTMYNVEMQTVDEQNLPKRSRLYQSEMDVMALQPGERFNKLPNSYVIFICTFDPFKKGLFRYTFEHMSRETGQLLEDGAVRIFLSTRGENYQDVPKALVDFLRFVECSDVLPAGEEQDEFLEKMYGRIQVIKRSRRWEEGYMRFEELMNEEREKGYIAGLTEGRREREELLKLVCAMSEDGLSDEISRLLRDPELFRAMKDKYQI